MIYELVLRNFNCSLEFVFSLLLLQPFNFSPVSFACNFQDWGCVIIREIDFLLKICWSIPCLHPSWKAHTMYKMEKVLQLKAIYNLEVSKFMYKYNTSQLPVTFSNYLNLLQMFIHITQDRLKLDNLLYQKYAQTQVLKW